MNKSGNTSSYYAVIFTSKRTEGDNGYAAMAKRMVDLASIQDGFLGVESAREEIGITVSYWRDLESIQKWKENAEHKFAQLIGKQEWYKYYSVKVARIEREYQFSNLLGSIL